MLFVLNPWPGLPAAQSSLRCRTTRSNCAQRVSIAQATSTTPQRGWHHSCTLAVCFGKVGNVSRAGRRPGLPKLTAPMLGIRSIMYVPPGGSLDTGDGWRVAAFSDVLGACPDLISSSGAIMRSPWIAVRRTASRDAEAAGRRRLSATLPAYDGPTHDAAGPAVGDSSSDRRVAPEPKNRIAAAGMAYVPRGCGPSRLPS